MNKWKQTSLGEFIDFNPPETILKSSMARKIPMDKLGVFQRKINGSEYSEYSAGPKFRNGDSLVAKITPCLENGKTAFVDILDENEVAFGSSEFIVLRENALSDKKFIYYLARSPLFRDRAISCMEGTSGRKRVNEGALKRQEILVPEILIQQKIASVLSALDDKIELNNKINIELEAMAKTLYDYWFVQFDFPNADGKPYKSSGGEIEYNNILKRQIPKKWENGTLSDLGEIIGGSTPPREIADYFSTSGTAWITPRDLSQNKGNKFIARGELDVSEEGIKIASLRIMPKGTVLLSTRAPVGYLAISQDFVTTNQGFKSFVPSKGYSSEFIYYTVKNLIPTIENNAVGSTFKEISAATLKGISLCLPDKDVIDKYNRTIMPIFKKQELLEQQNQELVFLRDWLLPMLMNGQVTVKDAYERLKGKLDMVAEGEEEYNKILK